MVIYKCKTQRLLPYARQRLWFDLRKQENQILSGLSAGERKAALDVEAQPKR